MRNSLKKKEKAPNVPICQPVHLLFSQESSLYQSSGLKSPKNRYISRIEPMLYFLSPPKKHLESSKLLKVSGLLSGLMSKNILDSFNKAIE